MKLCYRRRTARRDVSVKTLTAAALRNSVGTCSAFVVDLSYNKLYNKSTMNRGNEVRALLRVYDKLTKTLLVTA